MPSLVGMLKHKNKIADHRGDWLVMSVAVVHMCRDAAQESQIIFVFGMLRECLYFVYTCVYLNIDLYIYTYIYTYIYIYIYSSRCFLLYHS